MQEDVGVPDLGKSAEALTFLSRWDDPQKPQGASEAKALKVSGLPQG